MILAMAGALAMLGFAIMITLGLNRIGGQISAYSGGALLMSLVAFWLETLVIMTGAMAAVSYSQFEPGMATVLLLIVAALSLCPLVALKWEPRLWVAVLPAVLFFVAAWLLRAGYKRGPRGSCRPPASRARVAGSAPCRRLFQPQWNQGRTSLEVGLAFLRVLMDHPALLAELMVRADKNAAARV